jgi:hypothetical protein
MLRNANHANDRSMDSLLQHTFNSAFKFSEQLLNMFQMPTYCSEQIEFVPISYNWYSTISTAPIFSTCFCEFVKEDQQMH